jgi:hypothetical protein
MKILFINIHMHAKNLDALLKYNHYFFIINHTNLDQIDLSEFDIIYSPSQPLNVKKYPNTKFLFGPHFSVFPEKHHMDIICEKNVIYTHPSDWARDVWRNNPLCDNLRIESLPFGVNTEKFNQVLPIEEREGIFIYYKARHPIELEQINEFFSKLNYNIKIFNYTTRYSENDYLHALQNCKFGVWVGRHESQGFALEEALSCNIPLLVWDVTSMNQEYGYNYDDIPATCIPYWNENCGESFTNINDLPSVFSKFISNLHNYKPRDYILENLSIKKCDDIFTNLINSIQL